MYILCQNSYLTLQELDHWPPRPSGRKLMSAKTIVAAPMVLSTKFPHLTSAVAERKVYTHSKTVSEKEQHDTAVSCAKKPNCCLDDSIRPASQTLLW